MLRPLWIALSLLAMSCVQSSPDGAAQPEPVGLVDGTAVTANVVRSAEGQWRVDYTFAEPQTAMIFSRSKGDYRSGSWQAVAGSPELQRIGDFDAMIFNAPSRSASYNFEPYVGSLMRDYDPFMAFSDGGLAIYTGQFNLLPVADAGSVTTLQGDLANWQGEQPTIGVRVSSDLRMVVNGAVADGTIETTQFGTGTYVYLGESELEVGANYVGIIDGGLPDHVRANFDTDLASIFDFYESRWGIGLSQRATLYYAFGGFDTPGFSNNGSVVGSDLVVLVSAGEALKTPNDSVRFANLWFFAHEVAHMFQNEGLPLMSTAPHAWWHEGTANTMAYQLISGLGPAGQVYAQRAYASEVELCAAALERRPISGAPDQSPYSCGNLAALAMVSSLGGPSIYDIWTGFKARASEADLEVETVESLVFDTLAGLGLEPAVEEALRLFLSTTHQNGHDAIYELFDAAGLGYYHDEDGQLISIQLP